MLSKEFYTTESKCEKHLIEDESNRRNQTAENAFKIERFKFRTFDGHVRKYAKFKLAWIRWLLAPTSLFIFSLLEGRGIPVKYKSSHGDSELGNYSRAHSSDPSSQQGGLEFPNID